MNRHFHYGHILNGETTSTEVVEFDDPNTPASPDGTPFEFCVINPSLGIIFLNATNGNGGYAIATGGNQSRQMTEELVSAFGGHMRAIKAGTSRAFDVDGNVLPVN